jgi:hypothetical protein
MESQHIELSIIKAIEGKSKLTPAILDITGMSSARNRHLLNNLLDMPDVNYLEIGVWKGSTFVSALYKNNVTSACAIDDWSQFPESPMDIRTHFTKNCKRFDISYNLIECNCFAVNLKMMRSKINVFFYDGNHGRKLTRNSLLYYFSVLADEFMYIVDDYDWEGPALGVADALEKANLDVVYFKHLKSNEINDADTWWNGLGIFILRKR